MTDNLLDLAYLNSLIIVNELIDKTQRCAIVWDQLPNLAFHTTFTWQSKLHDVYLTPMQNAIVADVIINRRNVLSATSYFYPQVLDLYQAINDWINIDPMIQILQDLNETQGCDINTTIVISGGVKTGGSAFYRTVVKERGSGGVETGGSAEDSVN